MLRDYQERAIAMTFDWFNDNPEGNPILVMPTGSGKSHVIAELCKRSIKSWPSTRILMLTHMKELIEQNAEKLISHWPNAPIGIYSAGIGMRRIDQITFAGIQSVKDKYLRIGHRDIVIIDECHLVNNKESGVYREVLQNLKEINPNIRIIGLTATPYRLGQGPLTFGEHALFDDTVEPVSIEELVVRGFLAPLKSKHTETVLDVSSVKKRGGEFIESQLQAAIDIEETTKAVIKEVVMRSAGKKSWILFCAGVQHAEHCAEELRSYGITAECVSGKTPKSERAAIIKAHKAGKITAITNANVLTTGFDSPNIDYLIFLRPTMSAALYVQMAGRGMRLKEHADHCTVLDFAGNVEMHGPIVDVIPPSPSEPGGGEVPVKTCPQCDELVHISCMECPDCGYKWPKEERQYKLSSADIMGVQPQELIVSQWQWYVHTSRRSGLDMLKVKYYGSLSDPVITEYLVVNYTSNAGAVARASLQRIASRVGANMDLIRRALEDEELEDIVKELNFLSGPSSIKYTQKGKFYDVIDRIYSDHNAGSVGQAEIQEAV